MSGENICNPRWLALDQKYNVGSFDGYPLYCLGGSDYKIKQCDKY